MRASFNDPNAREDYKKAYDFVEEQRPLWVEKGREKEIALKGKGETKSDTEAKETVEIEAPGSRKSPTVDTTVLVQKNA